MFIEPLPAIKVLRSSGAKFMVRHFPPPVHCAPLERQTSVVAKFYKHLAPMEPEHHWLRLRAAPTAIRRGSAARCAEGLWPSFNG
jgi:hypothetical protein